jgi:hypothetical protein
VIVGEEPVVLVELNIVDQRYRAKTFDTRIRTVTDAVNAIRALGLS